MTLLTYQVFKTIADVGSFHKAADILGLTPSAISHAISSMENELGFSVLTRSKAGVNLTNYGEQLLPYVNAVLYVNPQAFISSIPSIRHGAVTHKNSTQSFSQIRDTGNACISVLGIVG